MARAREMVGKQCEMKCRVDWRVRIGELNMVYGGRYMSNTMKCI
jgi:hypothetical protein